MARAMIGAAFVALVAALGGLPPALAGSHRLAPLGALHSVVQQRAAATLESVPAPVQYAPPVAAPLDVVRGFEPPPTPYAAGHRGVDLRTAPDAVVRAAADGTVRFAGNVAGRPLVVLTHADGVVTEYEPVQPAVPIGAPVARGDPIGRLHGAHGTCDEDCLHWGARRDGAYFDPLTLLQPLGPIRLLPWR